MNPLPRRGRGQGEGDLSRRPLTPTLSPCGGEGAAVAKNATLDVMFLTTPFARATL
jgi:hypothetical protein